MHDQISERVSGRRKVVGWMFTARRREASGWILHVLNEESGGVSSFSEQQDLASRFGQSIWSAHSRTSRGLNEIWPQRHERGRLVV